jgi:hypothetical protein
MVPSLSPLVIPRFFRRRSSCESCGSKRVLAVDWEKDMLLLMLDTIRIFLKCKLTLCELEAMAHSVR